MSEQRIFQRFDIITVLEFRLLTALSGIFAGITRNFSYEGFCVETQCVDFEPGDSLEVRLRHPHNDLSVTVPAYVVWKKAADKFAYLMGIKLKETELDTKLRMMEIMSAAGDVPVDSFLSGGANEKVEHHEEAAAPALDSDQMKKYEPAPAQAEVIEEDAGPDEFEDDGLLTTEKDLITGKESGYLFDEVFKAAQTDGQEEEDMPDEEAMESDVPWPRVNAPEEDTDRTPGYSTRVLKQLLGNRMIIYSSIAAAILGMLVYAVFSILQRPVNTVESQAPVPAQSTGQAAFKDEEERLPVVPQVRDGGDNEAAAPAIQQQDDSPVSATVSSKPIEREAPAVLSKPAATDTGSANDQTLYIQVGAWGNPDNAREMLQKIQKYYPDAYLTAGKKLSRVKIPAKNKAQVNSIMKDIEDKFHIKALVSSVK